MLLILHPGQNKCGSSAIQQSIYSNLDHIRKNQIHVPNRLFEFPFEPHARTAADKPPVWLIDEYLLGKRDLKSFEDRIDAALRNASGSDCRKILISSENLVNFHYPHSVPFHRILASKFEAVQVIYYVRREDDWIQSSWQQWIHKAGLSLDDWSAICMDEYEGSLGGSGEVSLIEVGISFLKNARMLQRIYGNDAVSVVPMHRSAWRHGDLVADFYHWIGVDPPAGGNTGLAVNVALNPYLCEILGRIPNVYNSLHDNSVKDLLSRSVSNDLLLRKHDSYMSAELRDRITRHYESDNRQLRDEFFPDLDYEEVFSTRRSGTGLCGEADEIDGVKDLLAVQLELLLHLLRKESDSGSRRGFSRLWSRVKRRILRLFQPGTQ